MPSLTMNLVKRIERLPKPANAADAMQPLFEAVSNSIHSVQDKFKGSVGKNGHIVVTVTTDRKKAAVSAVVEDNGIGLDDKNYEAFRTTDTDNKITTGGKGVGRLLWLACFERVRVASIYEKGRALRRRSFDFELALDDQIKRYKDDSVSGTAPTGMTVAFRGLRTGEYEDKFPGRGTFVLQHFSSHFLPTFIAGRSPRITVHCGAETKEYPEAISELILRNETIKSVKSKNFGEFTLVLMECDKIASADLSGTHFIHFIAHDRTVRSQKIDNKLGFGYFGSDGDRVFQACLFGKFLDRNVNQERTNFTFPESAIEEIVNDVCMPHIEKFLNQPLEDQKGAQSKLLKQIAESYPSVGFGDVKELQDYVPLGELHSDAIFGHLSRERFRRDERQGKRIRDVLARLKTGDVDANSLATAIADASKEIEAAEQRSLAEYIVRRKVVLDFLEVLIQKVKDAPADSSYQREDVLHSFICPLKVNALKKRTVEASSHDLWVIDERLTFAEYFTSDIPFEELSELAKGKDRADILIFDKVHGLRQTDDSARVLMVEFKKPGRTSYRDGENPHQQVERYVRKLKEGQQVDVKGRPIQLTDATIFYCFIVADIVGKLDEWTFSWSRTADGRGRVYVPSSGFRGSIEVIGWDSLLADARERNRAFFDRAGLSGKSLFSDS